MLFKEVQKAGMYNSNKQLKVPGAKNSSWRPVLASLSMRAA